MSVQECQACNRQDCMMWEGCKEEHDGKKTKGKGKKMKDKKDKQDGKVVLAAKLLAEKGSATRAEMIEAAMARGGSKKASQSIVSVGLSFAIALGVVKKDSLGYSIINGEK